MNEVKIQIPDNCELIKDGNTYIVKEKDNKPKSWKEFCEKSPIKASEAYINYASEIETMEEEEDYERDNITSKNLCISEKEAEAFLALMQLRQLRKAWIGDWKPNFDEEVPCIGYNRSMVLVFYRKTNAPLTFPTPEMAEDFLRCFVRLCITAKILL